MSKSIFKEAGRSLGRHVTALLPKADQKLLEEPLTVVCVGSVWKSWRHLKPGFVEVLEQFRGVESRFELNLVQLREVGSIGALYIAADEIKMDMKKDYKNNYRSFFVFCKN